MSFLIGNENKVDKVNEPGGCIKLSNTSCCSDTPHLLPIHYSSSEIVDPLQQQKQSLHFSVVGQSNVSYVIAAIFLIVVIVVVVFQWTSSH
uniref:Transmembrane protein n=1 Tax=Romanomermis culicivorax TaxID=13658 RepID=A0A915IPK7_ROMCU